MCGSLAVGRWLFTRCVLASEKITQTHMHACIYTYMCHSSEAIQIRVLGLQIVDEDVGL